MSSKWEERIGPRRLPLLYSLWHLLPEPRDQRVSNSLIYLSTLIGGIVATCTLPSTLVQFIGQTMVFVLGLFSFVGSILGLAGVIPGLGWMEQTGIILVFTALLMYAVALLAASGAAVGPWFAGGLAVGLARRWIAIHLDHH